MVKAQNLAVEAAAARKVLHYTGADDDRGGVMSVIRALASTRQFECVLGVNPGFTQRRTPPLATKEFPTIAGEIISLRTLWRARAVARAASSWLREDGTRIFHAHSRAGLLAALWLARGRERRVVASVHWYGRQRWFYRFAAGRLGTRLFWLSPAMKRHYGVGDDSWAQCIHGCLPADGPLQPVRERKPAVKLRLGGVGALVPWKGWHLVVEALALLSAPVRSGVSFQHIGSALDTAESRSYAEHLRALTAQHGLAHSVAWLGEQPSADALLRGIDCLVIASHDEPFSIAGLEALAAGVPVLAADSGGAADLLHEGETGWFFRTGDARDLARAITSLVEGDGLARTHIGPETVQPYLASEVAARWERVYATR